MSDLESHNMQLRRISYKVFKYFFETVVVGGTMDCPFCKHWKSFTITKKAFEPKIYLASCETLTCAWHGDAEILIQRWTGLDHGSVQIILALFDTTASHKKIAAEIQRLTEIQRLEQKRTFQS